MNAYRTIDYADPSSMTTQVGPGDFFDVVNAWVVSTFSHIIHKLIQNIVCCPTEKPSRSPQIWSPYLSGGWIAVSHPFISPDVCEIFPVGQYPVVLLPTFSPPQELLEQCFTLSVPPIIGACPFPRTSLLANESDSKRDSTTPTRGICNCSFKFFQYLLHCVSKGRNPIVSSKREAI